MLDDNDESIIDEITKQLGSKSNKEKVAAEYYKFNTLMDLPEKFARTCTITTFDDSYKDGMKEDCGYVPLMKDFRGPGSMVHDFKVLCEHCGIAGWCRTTIYGSDTYLVIREFIDVYHKIVQIQTFDDEKENEKLCGRGCFAKYLTHYYMLEVLNMVDELAVIEEDNLSNHNHPIFDPARKGTQWIEFYDEEFKREWNQRNRLQDDKR